MWGQAGTDGGLHILAADMSDTQVRGVADDTPDAPRDPLPSDMSDTTGACDRPSGLRRVPERAPRRVPLGERRLPRRERTTALTPAPITPQAHLPSVRPAGLRARARRRAEQEPTRRTQHDEHSRHRHAPRTGTSQVGVGADPTGYPEGDEPEGPR